ncbi:hypothetical protein NDU88_006372 [Pleurodeles waltl]|uniref:Uncharacterized protein n=1 Tax=Pleurodeles waltl TaxID=8319 RepID=A0AAV7PJJ2_PLEWA|nr:hypothetical protein NDU88_006372 [Pleurodeles waltl]
MDGCLEPNCGAERIRLSGLWGLGTPKAWNLETLRLPEENNPWPVLFCFLSVWGGDPQEARGQMEEGPYALERWRSAGVQLSHWF